MDRRYPSRHDFSSRPYCSGGRPAFGFAFPIRGAAKFMGVVEFFSSEAREPDRDLLAMFDSIGSQIGQFIERRRAESDLRLYTDYLEAARARPGRRRAQTRGAGERARSGKAARRGSHARQERVSRQHEPRNPHADERHHRHDGAGARNQSDAGQREYLRTVKSSATSLISVIDDILDFSKVEAQQTRARPHGISAAGHARRRGTRSCPAALSAKDSNWRATCRRKFPTRLIGDPQRLQRIIINLVGNAMKFTEQGEVVVRASCGIAIGRTTLCCVSASPTPGIGIPRRQAAANFRGLRAGRQLHHSKIRRHGTGSRDFRAARGADGRAHLGG